MSVRVEIMVAMVVSDERDDLKEREEKDEDVRGVEHTETVVDTVKVAVVGSGVGRVDDVAGGRGR